MPINIPAAAQDVLPTLVVESYKRDVSTKLALTLAAELIREGADCDPYGLITPDFDLDPPRTPFDAIGRTQRRIVEGRRYAAGSDAPVRVLQFGFVSLMRAYIERGDRPGAAAKHAEAFMSREAAPSDTLKFFVNKKLDTPPFLLPIVDYVRDQGYVVVQYKQNEGFTGSARHIVDLALGRTAA